MLVHWYRRHLFSNHSASTYRPGSHGRSSWWVWPLAEVDTYSFRIPVLFYYHQLDCYFSVSSPSLLFRMWLQGFVPWCSRMNVHTANQNEGSHNTDMLNTTFLLPNNSRVFYRVAGEKWNIVSNNKHSYSCRRGEWLGLLLILLIRRPWIRFSVPFGKCLKQATTCSLHNISSS